MARIFRKNFDRYVPKTMLGRLISVLERVDTRRDILRVLTYHRIANPTDRPDLCPQLISATPTDFEHQMAYLATNYKTVSLPDVIDAFKRRRSLGPRAVLVTFDDAYRDFADNAWPILRRKNIPVTLFVATAFAADSARSFWWDRLYNAVRLGGLQDGDAGSDTHQNENAGNQMIRTFRRFATRIKSLPHDHAMCLIDRWCGRVPSPSPAILGWSELRSLARSGVTLGAHTRTHPLMTRLPPDMAAAQAIGSLEDLRTHVGPTAAVFAFPGGKSTCQVQRKLHDAGFSLAFTTRRGVNAVKRANPMALKRVHVAMTSCNAVFRGRLLSFWPHLRALAPS